MSKAALYQGIGAGLSVFGQGMFQQQAETARERRERRLMELREQYRIDADERARDRQLEDRQFAIDESNRADAIAFGRRQHERTEDFEHSQPLRDAQIGLMQAQAGAAESRGQQGRGLFGLIRPDVYETESMQAFQRHFEDTGERDWSLLRERRDVSESARMDAQIRKNALDRAAKSLASQFPEEAYERFGIPPGTPIMEAERMLFEQFYQHQRGAMGLGLMEQESQVDPGQALSEAQSALSAGVPKREVANRLAELGIPRATIDEFLMEEGAGLMGQAQKRSVGEGVGALAREGAEFGGDVLRTGLTPPWMESSPIRQTANRIGGEAMDIGRDMASGWREQSRAIQQREQGGEPSPESLPDGLIRDVAADLSSEGEPFVREQLRMAGVPAGQIDQIIEIAKASLQ